MTSQTSAIPAGMWTCTSCGALNPNRARECGECGEGRDEETTRRRLEAGRELSGVRKDLNAARGLFVLGAVVEALGLALSLWLRLAPGWVVAVSASVIALHVAGALLVYRQPVLWAYVIAGYRTLYIVPTTILDPPEKTVAILMAALSLAITVGLWFLPRRARRAQALIEEHPDLWDSLSHHRRREQAGDSLTARKGARSKRQASRNTGLQIGIAAGAAVVLLAVVWFVWLRAPSVDGPRQEFETAWAASSVEGVTELFTGENRAGMGASFGRLVSRRDWAGAFPPLGERTDQFRDIQGKTTYACGGGQLVVHWVMRGDEWVIRGLAPEGVGD